MAPPSPPPAPLGHECREVSGGEADRVRGDPDVGEPALLAEPVDGGRRDAKHAGCLTHRDEPAGSNPWRRLSRSLHVLCMEWGAEPGHGIQRAILAGREDPLGLHALA